MGDGLKRARTATARSRGEPKLTPAQRSLYDDILRKDGDRVVSGYKPAMKLKALGLIRIKEERGAWTLLPLEDVTESGDVG